MKTEFEKRIEELNNKRIKESFKDRPNRAKEILKEWGVKKIGDSNAVNYLGGKIDGLKEGRELTAKEIFEELNELCNYITDGTIIINQEHFKKFKEKYTKT